ncbi:hypothetical protein N9N26_00675 [Candidatus Poseidoniales archaeon]|jgi:hypothetical protein|nr:hypothetical protein [Candidatus Poseidoniales archaeon]
MALLDLRKNNIFPFGRKALVYKEYTTECAVCECSFTYDRRIQTRGVFTGRWMGASRKYCSNTCSRKNKTRLKKISEEGNSRKSRKTIVNRLCRKLGGVEIHQGNEIYLLKKLEELIDYTIAEVPHDEITVQQNYIDAVNDMLELGVINSDQQVKMMKIAERW